MKEGLLKHRKKEHNTPLSYREKLKEYKTGLKKELKKETSRKELEEAQLRMYQSNLEILDLDDTEKFKNLKNSMLSYKNGSLFCRSCSKTFTSRSELISHIRICFSIDNEWKKRYTKRTGEIVILEKGIGQLEKTAGSAADTGSMGIKNTCEIDNEKFRSNYPLKKLQKPKTDQLIEISDEENEISDELRGTSDEEIEISDEDMETSDEERENSDEESKVQMKKIELQMKKAKIQIKRRKLQMKKGKLQMKKGKIQKNNLLVYMPI